MKSSWLHLAATWMLIIQAAGWDGWLIFVTFYSVASLIFVPGSVLSFTAGAIYGFWGGLLLAVLGNGISATLSLLITRYLLRDWAARYFERNPTINDLSMAVKKDGWKIVCLTHLSPIMPFSLVNYAFGLTGIPAAEFLPATILGGLPASCVYVYLGTLAGNLATLSAPAQRPKEPIVWWLQGIGLVATIVLTIYLTHRATQVLKKKLPHQTRGN